MGDNNTGNSNATSTNITTTSAAMPTGNSTSNSSQPIQMANSTVTIEENNATNINCFLQSQSWPGVDPVDCSDASAGCTDPSDGSRLANLYNDTIVRALSSHCYCSINLHGLKSFATLASFR